MYAPRGTLPQRQQDGFSEAWERYQKYIRIRGWILLTLLLIFGCIAYYRIQRDRATPTTPESIAAGLSPIPLYPGMTLDTQAMAKDREGTMGMAHNMGIALGAPTTGHYTSADRPETIMAWYDQTLSAQGWKYVSSDLVIGHPSDSSYPLARYYDLGNIRAMITAKPKEGVTLLLVSRLSASLSNAPRRRN